MPKKQGHFTTGTLHRDKSTWADAVCKLIFTLTVMGLKEFRERSTCSGAYLAEKWQLCPNIQHKSHEEATEFSRDPTLPFDPASLGGFTHFGTHFALDDTTGHLELWGNSALQYTEHLCHSLSPKTSLSRKGLVMHCGNLYIIFDIFIAIATECRHLNIATDFL